MGWTKLVKRLNSRFVNAGSTVNGRRGMGERSGSSSVAVGVGVVASEKVVVVLKQSRQEVRTSLPMIGVVVISGPLLEDEMVMI